MKTETLDVLPGEGDVMVYEVRKVRHQCEECGELAHYKHTFLRDNARHNPMSEAYGRDDCSWCEDACRYVCREHKDVRTAPEGMRWCSTFAAIGRFAHMFIYEVRTEIEK